jgi:hypothetical protein
MQLSFAQWLDEFERALPQFLRPKFVHYSQDSLKDASSEAVARYLESGGEIFLPNRIIAGAWLYSIEPRKTICLMM